MRIFSREVAVWAAILIGGAAFGAEEKKDEALRPLPLTEEEIKTELAKETPEQKKLREELAELVKLGQRVYFNANCDAVQRIYSMNPDGSDQKGLTPSPHPGGVHPYLSTDGSKLTYCASVAREVAAKLIPAGDREHLLNTETTVVFVMPVAGGAPEPVAVGTVPRFSPDGKKVVYYYQMPGRARRVAIYDLEKKREHPVIRPGLEPGCYPVISPDGKYLYICGSKGALLELNAEGTEPLEDAKFLQQAFKVGCNVEFSRDMKWLTWVVDTGADTGGWLMYAPFDPAKAVRATKMALGWAANSVNYYPDFSPCGKYYIYAHADQQKGFKSYGLPARQELYVTRFPNCETTVRITWNGAANMHPQWWHPPAATGKN